MLTAKFSRSYLAANKNPMDPTAQRRTVFVFTVSGTKEDLQAYGEAQGENLRTNDAGQALYFTTNYSGDNIKLIITAKGSIAVDTSERDKLMALANSTSGVVQEKIAMLIAAQLMANLRTPVAPAYQAPAPVDEIVPEGADLSVPADVTAA